MPTLAILADDLTGAVDTGGAFARAGPVTSIVLTGGDVTAGVLAELGACEARLWGEVRPAMPWGIAMFPDAPGIPVATKAGSFGIPDALLACTRQLHRA